ncbi:MAG: glycerol kinase GlpK [Deltaproteobacteria bacterium]|nr:glycerol kinase GlpK [Deltaproteobacteria bacterium]
MRPDLVLAIDQGTTGTTAVLVDLGLHVIAKKTKEFRQIYPKPGWVEHDLEDIWRSAHETVSALLQEARVDAKRIAAIGITNQRETVGLWERATGRPIHNAIVWQCRRTSARCEVLKAEGHEERVREKTGLVLDPYFTGTKAEWLLDHVDGARAAAESGKLALGTIDTFLVSRLTGGAAHVTDVSNASRTLLFNLKTGAWDPELLELLRVPRRVLADVRSSSEVYGHTQGVPGLPDGIPIAGMAGDQQAALFGQACFQPGDVKCTYGTGAFALVNTGPQIKRSKHGMLSTAAWKLGPDAPLEYALEGSVFIAGAAVQWLRDGLGLFPESKDVEALARSVADSGDLVFVPALTGLGAPHWRADARGLIAGITRDTTKAHLARACLEAIALQCFEVIDALAKDAGGKIGEIKVDGGASANNLLMQIQADVAGRPVVRPEMIETTAAGAAFLAGLGAGVFRSKEEIRAVWRADRRFEANGGSDVEKLLEKWNRAIGRA